MSTNQNFGLSQKQQEVSQCSDAAMLFIPANGGLNEKVITSRISWLLQSQNVNNDQVLAVTAESSRLVKEQLSSVMSDELEVSGMWIGSIYAIALRLITRHADQSGLPSFFQLLDLPMQAKKLAPLCEGKSVTVEQAQQYINKMKEQGIRAKDVTSNDQLAEVYTSYESVCTKEGLVDFNELLLRSCELFEVNAPIAKQYRSQFAHMLVDSVNNLNQLQYRLLQDLISSDTKVFAVSDSNGSVDLDKFKADFGITKTLTV